jgi:hypothetical protein
MKIRDRVCIEEYWTNGNIVEINGDQLWIETDILKNGNYQLVECHKNDVIPLKTYKMRVSMRAIYEFELEATDENEAFAMMEFTDLDEDDIVAWDDFEIEKITEEK